MHLLNLIESAQNLTTQWFDGITYDVYTHGDANTSANVEPLMSIISIS
jgi:hypothetical protein